MPSKVLRSQLKQLIEIETQDTEAEILYGDATARPEQPSTAVPIRRRSRSTGSFCRRARLLYLSRSLLSRRRDT